MYLQLQCPNCQTAIRSEDMNIEKLIAKCNHCHTVFGFEAQVRQAERQRTEVLLPPGIETTSFLSELDIQINWRKTSSSSFFLFFTLFWNAIVIPFAIFAILSGNWMILLFLSVHLLIGLSFMYVTIASFLNTTYITINSRQISVEHKPLKMPFYPDRALSVSSVKQLYIDKYVESKTNGQPNYAYGVYAQVEDQNPVKLIRGLKNGEQARYIEQEIERFLNMEDKAVEGEWL